MRCADSPPIIDVPLAAQSTRSARSTTRRPARVARMLAIAHHLRAAIDRGQLLDQAHAARCLGFTRARLTQLVDLTLLAPDLQEEILFLEAEGGVEPLAERGLRGVARHREWAAQRAAWQALRRDRADVARHGRATGSGTLPSP